MNIVLLMFALPVLAQSGGTATVSGVVTSAEDKYPLIGAHVIAGDNNGVSTLLDGSYSIDVKPGDVLTYYYVGYEEVKYTVPDGAASIKHNVELKAETKSLEDVVVIAYGVRKKGTIAGSVSTVKAEKIENTPTAAFDQALQGQVPGLTVLSSSGEPSVAATLSIRGTNSINSGTAPLYILDGAAISSADFNTINPADIESISGSRTPRRHRSTAPAPRTAWSSSRPSAEVWPRTARHRISILPYARVPAAAAGSD